MLFSKNLWQWFNLCSELLWPQIFQNTVDWFMHFISINNLSGYDVGISNESFKMMADGWVPLSWPPDRILYHCSLVLVGTQRQTLIDASTLKDFILWTGVKTTSFHDSFWQTVPLINSDEHMTNWIRTQFILCSVFFRQINQLDLYFHMTVRVLYSCLRS